MNRNKSLCPFHNDNNPSMTVNSKKNIATCFSCGTTGNVISFVQKYEKQINNNNLTVNQAIAKVVEICHLNIDISHLKRQSYDKQYIIGSKRYSKREQELIEVNEFLTKLFHYNLTAIDKESRNYLYSRNVDDKQIKELNLGYCKKGQFLNMAQKNEKTKEDLLELGYLRIDDYGNLQESFTNRIMFPIQDEKGNVVSFAGRGIKGEVPKYLHTSESSIFKKKELLYNFSNAKTLSYNNELIIVEGFLDVVGARRIGYENVVATMGVALTPEHLKMIKRNHSSITLALDNDQAGHEAMLRLIPDLLQQGFKVNVIDISKLGDIQQCIEGTPVLDKAGILCGDAEAMNAATCFILSDIQSNSEAFIQEFPIESMYKVPQQANYALARFFTDLAWYFPPSKRAHLHELKRALSLLPD